MGRVLSLFSLSRYLKFVFYTFIEVRWCPLPYTAQGTSMSEEKSDSRCCNHKVKSTVRGAVV